jgi:hypothetical protein
MYEVTREELDGLTQMTSIYKKSIPVKITYDNICIHEFTTLTNTAKKSFDPRPIFSDVTTFASKRIDKAISEFKNKDFAFCSENTSPAFFAKSVGANSWQIKTIYLTLDICLHSYTEYDHSDFVFEDTAIHRVVVSLIAKFDTKYMYQTSKHNEDVFQCINEFYVDLGNALM